MEPTSRPGSRCRCPLASWGQRTEQPVATPPTVAHHIPLRIKSVPPIHNLALIHQFCSSTNFVVIHEFFPDESNSQSSASPDACSGMVPGRAPLRQASGWTDQGSSQQQAETRERQEPQSPVDPTNVHVWKLDSNMGQAAPLNTFTLQETLFVEQLAAIDERVRYQVADYM